MILTLIGKNVLYKIKLPKIKMGNYWISDKNGKKLINIEGNGENWTISSNNNVKVIKPKSLTDYNVSKIAQNSENIIKEIKLNEYSMNYVYIKDYSNDVFVLYCSPIYEENFTHFNIKNQQEILIGSGIGCDIFYNIPLVSSSHARIFFSNGKLMLENLDQNFGTFVNNTPVDARLKMLFNGDIIFIMGLKIIILGRSVYINNPFKRVNCNNEIFEINTNKVKTLELDNEEEDEEVELYSEKDYFARAPRITNVIEREKIKIDPPPQSDNKEGMPLLYVLASSLSMGMIMIISLISSFDRMSNGNASTKSLVLTVLTSVIMLISILCVPIMNRKYEKEQKRKNEEKRQTRYKEYINSKISLIDKVMQKQKNILYENYISAEECAQIIVNKGSRLWERKIEEPDFLTIRIGTGSVPLNADIEYPKVEFTMEDDNLVEILNTIINKSKILTNVPITISLTEKNIAALIVENDEKRLVEKFVQNMLMQLITLHSYSDLKLVFLLKNDVTHKWEHLKTLPHIWDDAKQVRFWAEDYNEMQEISNYLERELANRLEYENVDYKGFSPYYLIITDDYKKIENLKIITELLEVKKNVGFGIFCITNSLLNLPNGCKAFINLDGNKGYMFENEISSKNQKEFVFDSSYTFFFEKIGKQLSNIPIKYTAANKIELPNSYTFLEMYDVGKIEQLNILERWNNNDSTRSLQAPIGIDENGMPIVLDIHEKSHGPHGLVAGSTGSGKSEFLITYILSLTINYHPDDVTIILIDYKGGALAGAFQKNGIKLPHLVGTITNIDTVGLQRSLVSIQSELRRRQILFNEARNKTDEGTIDIYKYQKLYHEGIVSEPVPHLLIICDEFAELKQQQQDFMNELISVARIGRSLGVHLILATQKPAGVVDNQIRSNSRFGVCLRVQEREDSIDVIKRPDAADLKKAGQFFLQVGNNEYFTFGLAAWSGAPYIPSDIVKKNVDSSIKFISNIGAIIKEVGNSRKQVLTKQGEQLTNIVRYMYELSQKENIHSKPLWMENIPEIIFIAQLRKKYHITKKQNNISCVIGEYDDPYNQRQGAAEINLSTQGNAVIYGNAESGKETLLSTIVYDIMTNYTPEEAQLYILDFGSEALKIFRQSPSVGDVVFLGDDEKISRLFTMLQKEFKERTAILSDYNGDYNLYKKTSGNEMPMIIVMINNYEIFSENYESKYDDILLTLTRDGLKCGITFVTTTNSYNGLRYRLSQNFRQRIALQLNNQDEYLNIFDNLGKKRPSNIFGRGLIKLDDVYEFQTARICEPEKWNSYVKEVIEKLNKNTKLRAKSIPVLPERVMLEDVKDKLKDLTMVPVGINKNTLEIATYDFKKNIINMITSKNIDIAVQLVSHILEELKQLKDVNLYILDMERIIQTGKTDMSTNLQKFYLELEAAQQKNQNIVCVIIGLDKFINDEVNGEKRFYEILQKAQELKTVNFIIVETFKKLKSREYDEWFKAFVRNDTAIWAGSGITDQYLISINIGDKDIVNKCGDSFGYIIVREKAIPIKLLGIKENGDEDE